MHCQNCHAVVPDSAKVCGHCGTKLDREALFPCPSCGEDVPVTARVCGYCGRRLEAGSEKPAAKQSAVERSEPEKPAVKKTPPKKKEKTASAARSEKEAEKQKPEDVEITEAKAKKKIPMLIFGVAAVLVAFGAYFLFFRYNPSVDCLQGNWAGEVYLDGENIFKIYFDINSPCKNNAYCGKFRIPLFDAEGRIKITDQKGSKFYFFAEPNAGKPASEIPDEYLQCNRDGTLFYESFQEGGTIVPSAVLFPN